MLATTVQQSVAYVIVAIFVVGLLLWLVTNVRKAKSEIGSEIELAANRRPYFDDEGMEGKRLDGVLRWALISLTIVAVVVLVFGFVAGTTAAVVGGVVALGFFVVQWVVVPARMLGRLERRPGQ